MLFRSTSRSENESSNALIGLPSNHPGYISESSVCYPDFFKSKFAMECTCCSFRVPFALRIPPPVAYPSYTSSHLRTKIHFPDALKSTAADGLHTEERDHSPVLFKLQRDSRPLYPGNYPFKSHLRSGLSSAQHCCHVGCLSSYSTSRALPQPSLTSIYPRTFSAQRVDIPLPVNEGTCKALAFPVQRMPSSWNSVQIPRVNNNRQLLLNGEEPSAFSRASNRGRRYSRHQNAWGGPTYTELITKAILSTPECRMTLASIYEWISDHVPYFAERRECKTSEGWKVNKQF